MYPPPPTGLEFRTVIVEGLPDPGTDLSRLPQIDINDPRIVHQTVEYADGSCASGPAPLPLQSPDGSPAIKIDGVPLAPLEKRTPSKGKETIQ